MLKTIHCKKTGQPIGERSEESFELLKRMYKGENLKVILQSIPLCAGIAPHWIRTDEKALERLREIDPRGYLVFIISRICLYRQRTVDLDKGIISDPTIAVTFENSKVRAYAQTKEIDLSVVMHACAILKHWIATYNPKYLKLPQTLPHKLVNEQTLKNLAELVAADTYRMVKQEQINSPSRYAEFINSKGKGHSDLKTGQARKAYDASDNQNKKQPTPDQIAYAALISGFGKFKIIGDPTGMYKVETSYSANDKGIGVKRKLVLQTEVLKELTKQYKEKRYTGIVQRVDTSKGFSWGGQAR